jgi:hypothetical protein
MAGIFLPPCQAHLRGASIFQMIPKTRAEAWT